MTRYVNAYRDRFGVEPICRALDAGVSTYYARKTRPPSRRAVEDQILLERICRIHESNYREYGGPRIWRQLHREGITVGRCRVERLMRRHGIQGVRRGRKRWLTKPDLTAPRPPDLVDRQFTAERPNQLWLADLTYIRTWEGWVYLAVVLDAYARRIVGWQLATHLRTDLVLEALDMALWARDVRPPGQLIHHSDRGSQYTSFRYTTRLQDAGIAVSVGSVGDAYDNAMCESFIATLKAGLIDALVWRTRAEVELAVVEWLHWYNTIRLHSSIGYRPPAEKEQLWFNPQQPALVDVR